MFAETNGISTYYERTGRGLPLVLIHALGTSLRSWDPLIPALSQRYEVIAYDWRGHGRTEKAGGDYSLTLLARDLDALLGVLGIEKAYLAGVAVGAMIAQQVALDFPSEVAGLILSDCSSRSDPSVEQYVEARAARVQQEGVRVAVEATIERAFAPGFAEAHPEVVEQFRGEFLANDPHAYARASRLALALDVTERLQEIRCPTFLMVGEMDRLLPPAASEVIRQHIPGAALKLLPGVGHFSNIEAPDLFSRTVLEFLDALGAKGPGHSDQHDSMKER